VRFQRSSILKWIEPQIRPSVRWAQSKARPYLSDPVDYGDRLIMSEHSYDPPILRSIEDPTCTVTIGKYSSINSQVEILLSGNHHTEWVTTYPIRMMYELPGAGEDGHPVRKGPVVIGNDVWIGFRVIILSGITIGDGAVVGAGALVTKDVAPYSIVGGNPVTLLKHRFDSAVSDALLRIAWWDWPHEKVLAHVSQLCDPNVVAFVNYHDPAGPQTRCPYCQS
jgi:acetyltransferase-like isoleucine patch superfamily enzyme